MRNATIVVLAIAVTAGLAAAAPRKRPPRGKAKKPPVKVEPKKEPPAPTPDKEATPPDDEKPASAAGSGSAAVPSADAKPPKPEPVRAAEPADAGTDTDDGGPSVDALRQDYLKLRDELFASRARASTVASQLFSTRIQIKLTYTTGRFYNPGKATVRLDGANVYDDATGAIAGNDNVRFDGYIAPGRHVLTFRVEATGKDDDSFTSVTETQVVVKAVAGKDLVVSAKARDGGNIAYEWKKSEQGSYGLGIDVGVKTVARKGGK